VTSTNIKLAKIFEHGINFSCKMCGECCRGSDEGEVYVYRDDINRLTQHLNLTGKEGLRKFAQKYLKVVENTFFYKDSSSQRGKTYRFDTLAFAFEGEDEHCHFLVNNQCSVHEFRPFQCRCFPFWKMMVSSRKNVINYSKKCKGLRLLDGNHYTRKQILSWANEEYGIEKEYFLEMKRHDFEILKVYPFLTKDMI
jgi:Fe-S-cluster containining protein